MSNLSVLHAVPGFIGLPEDWDFLHSHLLDYQVVAHDLWNKPYRDFNHWGDEFNFGLNLGIQCLDRVVLGYSLGGRLALHALTQRPELWKAAILVSTHPGLFFLEERKLRLQEDELWSQRFAHEPWEKLMADWEKQPVFSQKNPFVREERKYDRKLLAQALKIWSLGNQKDFREAIQNLTMPILWIVGENDHKYVQLANSLSFSHHLSQVWMVENAAHRVPWEQQNRFLDKIKDFLMRSILPLQFESKIGHNNPEN